MFYFFFLCVYQLQKIFDEFKKFFPTEKNKKRINISWKIHPVTEFFKNFQISKFRNCGNETWKFYNIAGYIGIRIG